MRDTSHLWVSLPRTEGLNLSNQTQPRKASNVIWDPLPASQEVMAALKLTTL